MNYFGHAVVASWRATAAHPVGGLALGAMLPDFANMCGARVSGADHDGIAAGIALHHATDAAFHQLAPFTGLCRELEHRLTAGGVGRGPMRGAAHIGVELLLDGVLLDDADGRAAYVAAIEHPTGAIRWRHEGDEGRFAWLHGRLAVHGLPEDLRRADGVAYRVLRTLAPRPRLAPSGAEAAVIGRELAAMQPRVRVAASTIMTALAAAMPVQS